MEPIEVKTRDASLADWDSIVYRLLQEADSFGPNDTLSGYYEQRFKADVTTGNETDEKHGYHAGLSRFISEGNSAFVKIITVREEPVGLLWQHYRPGRLRYGSYDQENTMLSLEEKLRVNTIFNPGRELDEERAVSAITSDPILNVWESENKDSVIAEDVLLIEPIFISAKLEYSTDQKTQIVKRSVAHLKEATRNQDNLVVIFLARNGDHAYSLPLKIFCGLEVVPQFLDVSIKDWNKTITLFTSKVF